MNIFCFAGNLTKDIDVRVTQGGKRVASFSIAINEGKDKTTFINCIAWEKTAELLEQYVKKGDRLSGSGRLDVRSYEKDGEKKYVTEVVVSQFDFPPKRGQFDTQVYAKARSATVDEVEDGSPF